MPSLLATLGLDVSSFRAGLDKAVAQAEKSGGSIESGLIGKLKQSRIVQFIASPIGAASALAVGFIGKIISKIDELQQRAKDIKFAAGMTHLNTQQVQPVMNSAGATSTPIEAVGKAILKVAEAQEAVKHGGAGAAEALRAFSSLGVPLADIKNKSYQALFLGIAESMHVANLSGEQLTAGAHLMGKGFETLGPMFRRGFNDPMDQMKTLSDEELKKLNEMNRGTAVFKAGMSMMWQALATTALDKFTGGKKAADIFGDPADDANMKRMQEKLNARAAAKAKAGAAGQQQSLDREKNLAEAGKIEKQVEDQERLNKLKNMSAPERMTALKKESAELEKQKAFLLAKLKTEKDAASAPKIAELDRALARNRSEMATPGANLQRHELSLNANQRIGAYATLQTNPLLSPIQKTEQHLAEIKKAILIGNRVAPKSIDEHF